MNLFQLRISRIKKEMRKGIGSVTVYPYPISLEPIFELFQLPDSTPSIYERLFRKTSQETPNRYERPSPYAFIHIRPSVEDKTNLQGAEHILTALHITMPASFEIIGTHSRIVIQMAVSPEDRRGVIGTLAASYPQAEIFAKEDVLNKYFGHSPIYIQHYHLAESHFFPLLMDIKRVDPYISLFGALSGLGENEAGCLQVLYSPCRNDWGSNMLKASRSEHDPSASPFSDLPELPKLVQKKIESPLFSCSIRLIGTSPLVINRLEGFFAQFGGANRIVRGTGVYPASAAIQRSNHSSGLILNARELSGLIHQPMPEAIIQSVVRAKRTAPSPTIVRNPQGIIFGKNSHRGQTTSVSVGMDWLTRHCAVLGSSGSGKTIMLASFFYQFIQKYGGIYLDPSGDSARVFLKLIPPERVGDVIYINPYDPSHAPAFNIMDQATGDHDLTKSLILTVFKRLFGPEGMGPRSEWLLSNALSTLLKSQYRSKSLVDIPRLFTDKAFRTQVFSSISDPQIIHFWKAEYPGLPAQAFLPILNKLHVFLGHEKIREMLTQPSKIDIAKIIQDKKIMIINLSKGQLGETIASTLGFLFLASIQQAVLGLASIPSSERDYFAVIIDEAHMFLTRENVETVNSLMSESRKFKISNVFAFQFISQSDKKIRDAIMGNAGTIISFKVGVDDAQVLQKEFGIFNADDLLNLTPGEAIVRVGKAQDSFNIKAPFIDLNALPEGNSSEIINRSRELYCTPRKDIEKMYSTPHTVTVIENKINEDNKGDNQIQPLTPQDKIFLEHIIKNPTLSVTGIYRVQGLSGYMGDKIKKELIKWGLIKEVETHLGVGSRITKFLSLTGEGFKALGVKFNSNDGKGGVLHRYWQSVIRMHVEEKGYRAILEEPVPGTNESIDLGLTQDVKRIAVEISITTPVIHEVNNNITKCLKAGYSKVVVLTLEEAKMLDIQNLIKKFLSSEEQTKVIAGLVYDFDRFF